MSNNVLFNIKFINILMIVKVNKIIQYFITVRNHVRNQQKKNLLEENYRT
jgi:hypothetical protein